MIMELTSENFEKEAKQSDIPVIVDFFADWCPPCKMLAPVFEETSKGYGGKVKFVKVNVDQNKDLADEFEVRSIPTLIILKGGKEVERMMGFMPKDQLKAKIDKAI
ncbi:MAG: thioredoxin [Nanoarchaeota archaeon]|nr:thioredoxin [Nanoarchaeota archaeon]